LWRSTRVFAIISRRRGPSGSLWFQPPARDIIGDHEQSDPDLLVAADDLEMDVLGLAGVGRRQSARAVLRPGNPERSLIQGGRKIIGAT